MQVLAYICRLRLQRHSNFLSLVCLVGFLFLSYFQFTRYQHTSHNEHKWDFPILGCCLSSRGGVMWWDHLCNLPSLPQLSGCLWREGASGLPSQRLSLEQKLATAGSSLPVLPMHFSTSEEQWFFLSLVACYGCIYPSVVPHLQCLWTGLRGRTEERKGSLMTMRKDSQMEFPVVLWLDPFFLFYFQVSVLLGGKGENLRPSSKGEWFSLDT